MPQEPKIDKNDVAAAAAITIAVPAADSDGDVANMGMGNRGILCSASGTATPSNGKAIVYVGAFAGDPSETPPDSSDVSFWPFFWTNPNPVNNTPVNWSFPATIGSCPCADTPPSTHDNAKLWVIAFEARDDNTPAYVLAGMVSREFGGQAVNMCNNDKVRTANKEFALTSMSGSCCQSNLGAVPHLHEGSCGLNGDWLHYRRLHVNLLNGNRLLDECGQPLHASEIAVACKDVRWHPSHSSALTVRDSLPHVQHLSHPPAQNSPWRFPELLPYSVVIYQPGKNFAYVVKSMCADRPDILSLDPSADIYVTVNDRLRDYGDNIGQFSLLLSERR